MIKFRYDADHDFVPCNVHTFTSPPVCIYTIHRIHLSSDILHKLPHKGCTTWTFYRFPFSFYHYGWFWQLHTVCSQNICSSIKMWLSWHYGLSSTIERFSWPDQPLHITALVGIARYMHAYLGSSWPHYGMTAVAMFTVRWAVTRCQFSSIFWLYI